MILNENNLYSLFCVNIQWNTASMVGGSYEVRCIKSASRYNNCDQIGSEQGHKLAIIVTVTATVTVIITSIKELLLI